VDSGFDGQLLVFGAGALLYFILSDKLPFAGGKQAHFVLHNTLMSEVHFNHTPMRSLSSDV